MQQRPFRRDPHHYCLEENEQGRRRDDSLGDGRHANHERFAIFEAQTSAHASSLKKCEP
jgi:hypothetical protein